MANPLIRKIPKMTGQGTGGHKSAGILDDYAIRKDIQTREATIESAKIQDCRSENFIITEAGVDVGELSSSGGIVELSSESTASHVKITADNISNHVGIHTGAAGAASVFTVNRDAGGNGFLRLRGNGRIANTDATEESEITMDSNGLSIEALKGDIDITTVGKTTIGDGGTTNYTEIKADGEINLHGTARVEKCVTIRVGGFKAPGASPAALEDLGIAQCYAFSPLNDEYISTEITLPVDMDRSVAPTLIADWSAAATAGTAVWRLEYLYRAADEDMTAAAQETLRGESTPSGTSNGLVIAEMTGIDLPSSTDRVMLVRISRDTTDAVYTDDMAGDAHLTAIKLCYTSNKLGTAL